MTNLNNPSLWSCCMSQRYERYAPAVWSIGMIPQYDSSEWSHSMIHRYDPAVWSIGMIPQYDSSIWSIDSIWSIGMIQWYDPSEWSHSMIHRYDPTVWFIGMIHGMSPGRTVLGKRQGDNLLATATMYNAITKCPTTWIGRKSSPVKQVCLLYNCYCIQYITFFTVTGFLNFKKA